MGSPSGQDVIDEEEDDLSEDSQESSGVHTILSQTTVNDFEKNLSSKTRTKRGVFLQSPDGRSPMARGVFLQSPTPHGMPFTSAKSLEKSKFYQQFKNMKKSNFGAMVMT